jgi:hypothetical protein
MSSTKQNPSAGGAGARNIVRVTTANNSEIKPYCTDFQPRCSDIFTEHQKCNHLSGEVLAALLRHKVDVKAIWRRVRNGLADHPKQAHVFYVSENSFEFAAYKPGVPSSLAIIFMVRNHVGDPIDLAAWNGGKRRPALWCTAGALLGGENLFRPRMTEGLVVNPSPMEWLRAACNGVVLIDEVKAAPLLRRAEPLEASSIAHGRHLAQITKVKPPRILVPSPTSRRAAWAS